MSAEPSMAQPRRRLALWAAVLSLLQGLGAQAQTGAPVETRSTFERAMDEYEAQRFEAAFDGFARLADTGHREAARIALMMRAHGSRLYGRSFQVDPARRQRWIDAAAPGFTAASPRP